MWNYLLPVLFTVCAWWIATAAVLRLNRQSAFSLSMGFWSVSALALMAVIGLIATRNSTSVASIYCAFSCSLILWAWHEVSYYAGVVTGPRPAACPEGVGVGGRFRYGVAASLYHELAIIGTGAGLFLLLGDVANTVGLWTFCILWAMRWSAKLNIFLGVANLHADFWPGHLRYLDSYVTHRRMNPLFPFSAAAALAVLIWMIVSVTQLPAQSADATALLLLASLLALGLLEHCFLVMPIPDEVLWRWAIRSQEKVVDPPVQSGSAEHA